MHSRHGGWRHGGARGGIGGKRRRRRGQHHRAGGNIGTSVMPVATPEPVLPAPSCFGGGARSEPAEPEDGLGPSNGPSLTKSTYHCIETPNMAVSHQCPRGLKANGLELTGMD
jgi:hypothetical protein